MRRAGEKRITPIRATREEKAAGGQDRSYLLNVFRNRPLGRRSVPAFEMQVGGFYGSRTEQVAKMRNS